ncbi:Helicase conserved C-terminal domain containing protein, putative [Angomonas deanei]|uniref:Helicase conserved C-terminal domain containing protein, putative n=1 Tax=Angomonas deanei TaxID=59799 RepID=A0A7G2CHH4_9TRYP|nr:Helicase conserved C-terminal domain containing protein, putative [Angomonas deanei]
MSFRSNLPVRLEGSAKLRVLCDMCLEWKETGHRALIFSQTRMMLDIIENMCVQYGFRYVRLDGTTGATQRQQLMDLYNHNDDIPFALLTTKVGGVGLNLTGADRVVLFDPNWNPITDIQARERAWRIGQLKNVIVYRFISTGTVEENVLKRQLAKLYVTEKVLTDASLQKFFNASSNNNSLDGNDSFIDHFFLGDVYKDRLPGTQHYLLGAPQVLARYSRPRQQTERETNANPMLAEEIELPTAPQKIIIIIIIIVIIKPIPRKHT